MKELRQASVAPYLLIYTVLVMACAYLIFGVARSPAGEWIWLAGYQLGDILLKSWSVVFIGLIPFFNRDRAGTYLLAASILLVAALITRSF